MKIYRQPDGRCNVSGIQIKALREARFLSQEQLAAKAQLAGLNITQKAISRIETGERIVTDYELIQFSIIFHTSVTPASRARIIISEHNKN